MIMSAVDFHGYDASAGYTYGFCPEMAPDWLDLSAMLAGAAPARRDGEAPFRYLELGCGQGMGLCLLAAANPQGQFVGVDFLPDHVAHARAVAQAAGLTNIQFSDGDFVALAQQWPVDFGRFDYVSLHGVYSWITPPVRTALVRCLGQATASGGLVYIGYNAQPGWLGSMPFRHISRLLKEESNQPSEAVMQASIGLFDRLAAGGANSFRILPGLKSRLAAVKRQASNYLIHEYLHAGWHPLWHSEVAKEVAGEGLTFVGTASLAETLLPGALPPPLRATVEEQVSSVLRIDVQDLVINQSFRRDVFRPSSLWPTLAGDVVPEGKKIYLLKPVEGDSLTIATSFSEIILQAPAYAEIVSALDAGGRSIGELLALPAMRKQGRSNALQIMALLLHARLVGVGRSAPASIRAVQGLNRFIAEEASRGRRYDHLAAASLGSAVVATADDLRLLDAWLAAKGRIDAKSLAATCADKPMGDQGAPADGQTAITPDRAAAFLNQTLPRWRKLGAVAQGRA